MKNDQSFAWRIFLYEMAGTALLLLGGLSAVILMFGAGSPMPKLIPGVALRQVVTGFLFGLTGATIALSRVGKVSGAHINPAVTTVFWLFRKIDGRTAIVYVLAQLAGAVLGCLPLLFWGQMGKSVSFGATLPGEGYSMQTVLLGEVITTFTMVSLLIVFIGFRQIRAYTPAIFPILYAVMVPLESAISGTSTNPARSFGPSVISGQWESWWVYWIGPLMGALLASLACSWLAKRITVAKLYHFDRDRDGMFRKMSAPDKASSIITQTNDTEQSITSA
jgi:aquaporin Z